MSVLVDIEKTLGKFHLSVRFEAGEEVVALLGASGCGKSLTLKCIAGIEKPDRGRIVVDGVTLFDSEKKINLSPQQRRAGLMFQNYALFPNMTVLQNIQAGARREKDPQVREKLVTSIVDSFGLSSLLGHYPRQLSGGQQQRTALARMLVSRPNILLLDEPFSALDSHLRFRLEREVGQVMRRFSKTVILVSHDRNEVFRLSDKIAVMNDGRIETFGDRDRVFSDPQAVNAAVLTGCANISKLEKLDQRRVRAVEWGIELELACDVQDEAYVGIRAHHILLGEGRNQFVLRVEDEIENPQSYTVLLSQEECAYHTPLNWEVNKETWNQLRSETVTVHIPSEDIILLKG